MVWTWTASGPRAVRPVLLLNLQRFTPGFTSSAGGDVAAVVKPTHRNTCKPWEQRVQYIWFLRSLKLPEDLKDFEVQGYHSVAQRFPNKLPNYRIIPGTTWNIQQAYKNAIELHCSDLEIYEIYSDLLYSSLVIFQFCSIYTKDLQHYRIIESYRYV